MRKRAISTICAFSMLICLLLSTSTGMSAEASDNRPMLDGSYLTNETESTGTDTKITRGENLQVGYSKIRKVKAGVVYAGGTTIGEHTCKSIQITVIVERAKWEDEEWEVVETWHKENTDADLVSTGKRLEVEGGWYYRVFCVHSADGDMSDSFTDGIYVEEP